MDATSNKVEQEVTTDPEIISALICGRRPEGMDFETYKIMRKSVQKFLKRRKQGKLIKNV